MGLGFIRFPFCIDSNLRQNLNDPNGAPPKEHSLVYFFGFLRQNEGASPDEDVVPSPFWGRGVDSKGANATPQLSKKDTGRELVSLRRRSLALWHGEQRETQAVSLGERWIPSLW